MRFIVNLIQKMNFSKKQFFDLKKYVYDTIDFQIEDKLAICYLDDKIFEKTHTSIDDTKGVSNIIGIPFNLSLYITFIRLSKPI